MANEIDAFVNDARVSAGVRAELETEVVLETRLDSTLPKVMGDRVQLQQVILNLVKNAAEAVADQHESESLDEENRLKSDFVRKVREALDEGERDAGQQTITATYGMGPAAMPHVVSVMLAVLGIGGLGLIRRKRQGMHSVQLIAARGSCSKCNAIDICRKNR